MKDIVKIFKALSDPTRLRIFLLLMKKDLCVCELTLVLEMSQSRVSHQLRLLRDADLVEDKRDGRWIIYMVPASVRENLEPLLRHFAARELAASESALGDVKRLEVCLRENVRKKRKSETPQPAV